MRYGRKLLALALVVGTLGAAGPAAAQTSESATASVSINQVLYLDVTNTNVTFSEPTASDFNSGEILSSVQSDITHRANIVHDVEVAADASNFSGGSGSKPASDLHWSLDGSTWTPLSTTAADLVTGVAPGAYDNAETVSYKLLLDYSTDEPGSYSLGFTYTIVAN